MWRIIMSKTAMRDAVKVKGGHLADTVSALLAILAVNPFQTPPPYEKLEPPTSDSYSRRINRQHRLYYKVDKTLKTVKILRMWTHYE